MIIVTMKCTLVINMAQVGADEILKKLTNKYFSLTYQKKIIKEFLYFLEQSGAEILSTTNIYEVLRFKANGKVGILYKNKNDRISSMNEEALNAFDLFLKKERYHATERKKRIRKSVVIKSLLQRDGKNCFYCSKEMHDGEETLEHLLSIVHGGNNHISNLALCHKECNLISGRLSVVEKIMLREKLSAL